MIYISVFLGGMFGSIIGAVIVVYLIVRYFKKEGVI